MIGTFKNFQGFEQRGEWALQAYLRRAVINRIRDELRRVEGQPLREEFPASAAVGEASPLEVAIGREMFGRYDSALGALDGVEREAVIARLELGCSYQEIAALVDKPSADAARMMVARALAKMARMMA